MEWKASHAKAVPSRIQTPPTPSRGLLRLEEKPKPRAQPNPTSPSTPSSPSSPAAPHSPSSDPSPRPQHPQSPPPPPGLNPPQSFHPQLPTERQKPPSPPSTPRSQAHRARTRLIHMPDRRIYECHARGSALRGHLVEALIVRRWSAGTSALVRDLMTGQQTVLPFRTLRRTKPPEPEPQKP